MIELYKYFEEKENVVLSVSSVDYFEYDRDIERLKNVPYVNYPYRSRIYPREVMKNATTLIMIGVPYDRIQFNTNRLYGKIASTGYNSDYHKIVHSKLKLLLTIINKNFHKSDSVAFVDTGPLLEGFFAVKGGLGFLGENGLIINERYGSFFNIGYIITEAKLPSYREDRTNDRCFQCLKCIEACPTKSINIFGNISSQCISFLTQTKKSLTDIEVKHIDNNLYGCDICQNICPHNKHIKIKNIENSNINNIENILKLSNRTYKENYLGTGLYWRGKKNLQRNAKISKINYEK